MRSAVTGVGVMTAIFLLFLAVLGLLCCTRAFSSGSEGGVPLWCSLQASHCSSFSSGGAQAVEQVGISTCGPWAWLFPSTWDLPGPEIEPVSPVLAGRFLTPGLPGKFPTMLLFIHSALRMPCKATIDQERALQRG